MSTNDLRPKLHPAEFVYEEALRRILSVERFGHDGDANADIFRSGDWPRVSIALADALDVLAGSRQDVSLARAATMLGGNPGDIGASLGAIAALLLALAPERTVNAEGVT